MKKKDKLSLSVIMFIQIDWSYTEELGCMGCWWNINRHIYFAGIIAAHLDQVFDSELWEEIDCKEIRREKHADACQRQKDS